VIEQERMLDDKSSQHLENCIAIGLKAGKSDDAEIASSS
jgi:hypothetical protein